MCPKTVLAKNGAVFFRFRQSKIGRFDDVQSGDFTGVLQECRRRDRRGVRGFPCEYRGKECAGQAQRAAGFASRGRDCDPSVRVEGRGGEDREHEPGVPGRRGQSGAFQLWGKRGKLREDRIDGGCGAVLSQYRKRFQEGAVRPGFHGVGQRVQRGAGCRCRGQPARNSKHMG